MYFPKGIWYGHWTKTPIKGGKEAWVDADIDSMSLFVKEGSVIPKYPIQQYVGEKDFDEITLEIYFTKGKENFLLYDDAHDGCDHTKGRYSLRTFKLTGKSNELILQQHKTGKFSTKYSKFRLEFIGLPFAISKIQIDNEFIDFAEVNANGGKTFVVNKDFNEIHVFE